MVARHTVKQLASERDYLAPDESEIRLLVDGAHGGLAHCTLPPGRVSKAVEHANVEELWYVLAGEGQVWRSPTDSEPVIDVRSGTSLVISPGVRFQFRNTGMAPLELLIATIPPWPGASEATPVEGRWSTRTCVATADPEAVGCSERRT